MSGTTGSDSRYTVLPVIEITNISKQAIILNIKPRTNSPVYAKDGGQSIVPGASITVEDNRVDMRQVNKLATAKLLKYERIQKKIVL